MDHTKKFRFLDVRKFFELPEKVVPNTFSNSRRTALKQMSTLIIGISPGINTLGKVLKDSFTFQQKEKGVVFYYHGNPAWEILPALFDGKVRVVFEENDQEIRLELKNAFYPGTRICADFKALITQQSSVWKMSITFPSIHATKNLLFMDWLRGKSIVPGLITRDLNYPLDRNDRLDISGPIELTIDRRWQMHLKPEGKAKLKLFDNQEEYQELVISLIKTDGVKNQFSKTANKSTLFELQSPLGNLQSIESLKFSGKQILGNSGYPFSFTNLVLSKSSGKIQKALWAGSSTGREANTHFLLQTNGVNKLELFGNRFFKEYHEDGSPFIYTADLGDTPQWIGAGGAAFALKGSSDQQFVISGNGKKVESLECKALLAGSRIQVAGGQSVPIAYKDTPEVNVLLQDPIKVKPRTLKPGQILNTGKILEVAPDDDSKANWIYVNREPMKVKFKVDRPILFNVIRPEDFINLQFEFVNFVLEDNLLKIDDKKDPSFLIVHFPSQHTREEIMRDINAPTVVTIGRKSNSSIVPVLHTPVKFMRAGSSRLVYRVPDGYDPIPVTLDNLLDWRNFDIQVNYRARWFNQISGISLIKNQLQSGSMVFTRKTSTSGLQLRSPEVSYQARTIKAVDSKKAGVTNLQKPKSVQEVKVVMATTPKGSGVMALSDEQFNGLLATPMVDTINTASLQGQMKRLFEMKEPSKYETMIEAPTYFQISPNQFSGFSHMTELRDATGNYDPAEAGVVETNDENSNATIVNPVRNPNQTIKRVSPAASKIQASNINYFRNVVIGSTATPRYKGIVSSTLMKMPLALALPKGSLFELWHTRMGVKLASGEIDEDALNQLKTVRVLWSEFADEKFDKTEQIAEIDNYFYSLPTPQHAHQLVHLTSNYTDLKIAGTRIKYNPRPVRADLLMLSALGSWIDFKLNIPEDVELLSIKAWLQRATMGRDHYIKIVERGTLFPFGHKALLVTIAERRIRTINNVNSAVLIQREFIIVKQPELFYGKQAGSNDFIPFPFQRVEIKDLESEVFSETVLDAAEMTLGKELNMPDGSGKPYYFRIDVDDASGKTVRMKVPMVWISAIVKSGGDGLIKHYNDSNWDYFTSNAPAKPLAYARSLVPGDTTFETAGIIFKARSYSNADTGGSYYPEILESSIYIKQLEELTGNRKPVTIKLIDDNNMSMVFAEIIDEEKQALVFDNTEKGGGFLAPNMNINGLSKLTGLVGNKIEDLEKMVLQLDDIFKMADKLIPKLFGVISFIDLLVDKVDLTPALNNIKSAIESIRSEIEDLQQEILTILARVDNEVKKLDLFIEVIGSLLNETDIVGALQDIQKLSVAFANYGIEIEGDAIDALNATVVVGKEIQAKGIELDSVVGFVGNSQGLKNKLKDAGIQMKPEIDSGIDKLLKVVKALNQKGFGDIEIIGVIGGLGLASQLFDVQGLIKTLAAQVADKVLNAIPEIPNVKFQIKGNEIIVEYHWKPKTKNQYSVAEIFTIKNLNTSRSQIDVSIDSIMTKTLNLNSAPKFDVNAAIKEFSITIANTIQLNFQKIAFKAGMSSKADVDVKFQAVPIRLVGSLSFVNSLQSVVKSDQFSSGPFINITGVGIEAGYNFPIPNLEVGIFALSNLMLGTKLTLPLDRSPLKLGFNFCARENPFHLMVSCFGGGGFFAIETTMNGLTRLDAAFEFGAGISLNVGVASGSVSVMGGIYYGMIITESGDSSYTLTAYIRMTGRLSIIGLIKVTLEFYLELSYKSGAVKSEVDGVKLYKDSQLVGSATLTVKVEVLFFSKKVKVTVSRTFSGNDADPTFAQSYNQDHWLEYCNAFALN